MNEVRTLGFGDITGDEWQPNDDISDYGFKKGGGDLQPEINKSNKKTKKNILVFNLNRTEFVLKIFGLYLTYVYFLD